VEIDADLDAMTRVLNRLARRRGEIAVHIVDGVVVLRGWTRNYHQKQLAQEAMKSKIGSKQLINEIEVRR
jgi:osmotically-inducible protein OsmY